jgi:hypothetical protein
VQIGEATLRPPALAARILELANACETAGQYRDAIGYLQRSVDILNHSCGNCDHPTIASILRKMVTVHRKNNDAVKASQFEQRAEEMDHRLKSK